MRVSCNRCQTQYEVPDEKLVRGAVKVRCSQCGHTFGVRTRSSKTAPAEPEPAEIDFSSFVREPPAEPEGTSPPQGAGTEVLPEARFEDFDFQFRTEPAAAPAAAEEPPSKLDGLSDDDMASLGELDLGDFDDLDKDLDLRGEPMAGAAAPAEPAERVREEDLLSPRSREMPVQGLTEDVPRLDIQRGPRRQETPGKPSPIVARDRRRSPLFWVVVVVALGTLTFTGYNIYRHPDKAFTFLSPTKIRALWQRRQIEARFNREGLSGDYLNLSAGRRAFVIRGDLINRSTSPQSLLRVQGILYGSDGSVVASREVFCGNVLSDGELSSLSDETIEARLQNEVGQAMSNMEVPPGGRVPFMVVFPSPPDGVEKFDAYPVGARAGAGN